MKTLYRIETFVNNCGNWFFAKIVDGKCVYFFPVENEDRAKRLFLRITDGYDPTMDKRRRSAVYPDHFYREFVRKSEGPAPTVRRGPYYERGKF